MIGIFFGLVLLLCALGIELNGRAQLKLTPSNFRQLMKYLSKKTTPSSRTTAFLFALISCVVFGLWEFMIGEMLSVSRGPIFGIVGCGLLSYAVVRRRKHLNSGVASVDRQYLYLLISGWIIVTTSLLCALLSPWLYWRASQFQSSRTKA